MKCIKDVFVETFVTSNTRPFEVFFAILLLVSALNVLNPFTNVYGSSKTFFYIQWIPEPLFGSVLLFVALNKFAAVCVGGWWYRFLTGVASCVLFWSMFILFLSANPAGMLIPWIGVAATTCTIMLVRLVLDKYT